MSESAAKTRPMIDLDEFERRLRRPAAAAPGAQDDPLAELARLVGGQADPFKNVFDREERAPQLQRNAAPPVSVPAPEAYPHETYADEAEPQFHGTIHPANYEASEPPMTVAQPEYQPAYAEQEYAWPEAEAPAIAPPPPAADIPRSRRPLFMTVAIIGVGILGIGVSFAYKSKSGSHEIATINAMSGPVKVQPDSPGGVDVPNQDASILDKTQQPAPTGLTDRREKPVDLALQQNMGSQKVLMADAGGAASVPVPVPPGAQNGQGYGIGALIEPKKVKTVSVRSDGTLLPNDTPPQMPASSSNVPPAAATRSAVPTAKPVTPKSTARVVTTPKPPQSIEQIADGDNDAAAATPPAAAAKPKTPAPKPIKVAEAETNTAADTDAAASSGGFAVQFAAPATEQEAHELTAKLTQKFGSDLSGHHLTYHRVKVGDKTVYRVRTAGLSQDEAKGICDKVKSGGGSCFIAKN